jgi:hypothetical protein
VSATSTTTRVSPFQADAGRVTAAVSPGRSRDMNNSSSRMADGSMRSASEPEEALGEKLATVTS